MKPVPTGAAGHVWRSFGKVTPKRFIHCDNLIRRYLAALLFFKYFFKYILYISKNAFSNKIQIIVREISMSDKDDKEISLQNNEEPPPPEGDIEIHNVYLGIKITGKVIAKKYERKIKRILFRIETPMEFTGDENLSIKRVIFQFGMLKKLYRKYKKILYEGNNVSVFGFVLSILVGKTESGEEINQYIIDAQLIEEVKIALPTIPEEVYT
jgi:hypothetical protein